MQTVDAKEDWHSKLLTLKGVTSELINEANIASSFYKNLYLKLFQAIRFFDFYSNHLGIQSWRIRALTGDTTFYDNLIQQIDPQGTNLAHYAAWSGNITALNWVKKRMPKLLSKANYHGLTIAHYGAWSGNPDVLDWVKANAPQFLSLRKNAGLTLACFAALSGNPAMLDWIKNYNPAFLSDGSRDGLTVAHFAAMSGTSTVLEWVKTYYPELLGIKDTDDLTIAHHAASSSNPAQFNYCIELSGNLSHFTIPKSLFLKNEVVATICQWLDSNYTLTSIDLPPEVCAELAEQVYAKLTRNRAIQEVLKVFIPLLQCSYQMEHYYLPVEILKQILTLSLPGIPKESIAQFYDKTWQLVNPETRKTALQKNALRARINKEHSLISSKDEVIALREISALVNNHQVTDKESLAEKVSQWKEKNQRLMEHHNSKMSFFSKTPPIKKLMEDVYGILKVDRINFSAKLNYAI